MKIANVPKVDGRYWLIISLASIFGCNCGDFVSHIFALGDWKGLAPLAAILVAILYLERHSRWLGDAWYWAAIIVLRTAATNIADLCTEELKIPFAWVIAVLEVILVLLASRTYLRSESADSLTAARPSTNGWYWASMLAAGALGTAIGDCAADEFGLNSGGATLVLAPVLALILLLGYRKRWSTRLSYWFAIVAVRAAGTTAGDFIAFRHGLGLGLQTSTAITGCVFAAAIVFWRRPPQLSGAMVSQDPAS